MFALTVQPWRLSSNWYSQQLLRKLGAAPNSVDKIKLKRKAPCSWPLSRVAVAGARHKLHVQMEPT